MSVTFAAALLAQAVSLALLRHRLGRRWLRHPTTLFMLASTVDLGVGPALLHIPSIAATDPYAVGVKQSFPDLADLIMSAAMLVFTVGYLLTRPEEAVATGRPADRAIVARVLDWKVLAAACVPLIVVTATGQGYKVGILETPDSLKTNIVSTFFVIVVAAASTAFVIRFGSRWFLAVLIVQSILVAVAGERTPILMDALALVLILQFVGVPIRRRQLVAATLLAVFGVLAITGVRADQGRTVFSANDGLASRVSALGKALLSGGLSASDDGQPGLVAQFAIRESGVDFAGAILQSISDGQPRLSPEYVPESLLLVVPSFLWSNKLNLGNDLNPAQQQINDFGLQQTNYIPSMVGTYIGYLTVPWLLILFVALGYIFGRFERWLLRKCTPARVILLAGAVASALWYEAGLPAIAAQMRAAAVLAVAAKCIEMALCRRSSVQHAPPLSLAHGSAARSRPYEGGN